MAENQGDLKYYADWEQPQGKTTKKDSKVHIHPYDLISFVQKRHGLEKAKELAIKLIIKKYHPLFDKEFKKMDEYVASTSSPN